MKFSSNALALILAAASLCPSTAQTPLKTVVATDVEMVVTPHYLATEAGEKVLADGGTAADAMIAVQTVLGLVEPQASGVLGGAFLVYYDGLKGTTTTFDAREMTPALATENRYVDPTTNETIQWSMAWQSALGVGVPGVPKLFEEMHKKFGKLEWAGLFEYAKDLAINGYEQSGRTEDQVNGLLGRNPDCENRLFFRDPVSFEYFVDVDNCTAKPKGTIMKNSDYAEAMTLLQEKGADAIYKGIIADNIVAKLEADLNPTGDATISLEDLAGYEVVEREPVCQMYRGVHNICGMGPPSSGALAIGQILGIMENFELESTGPANVNTTHLFTQAGRLAFADRNKYVGDSDFVDVPIAGMLNKDYLKSRAALITDMDMGKATAGVPPGAALLNAPQNTTYEGGTSHMSIVDQYGNCVSMTTSIESYFGSGLMVNGMMLNNQLTDFSFASYDADGMPIANRPQPKKRPRSSMSPTIILNTDGKPTIITGSPGGFRIIGYTAQSILSMVDFGMNPQEAANTPGYRSQNGNTELEPPREGITTEYDFDYVMASLEAKGHVISVRGGEASGLSIIQILEDGSFLGGADPRRDGSAAGRTSPPDAIDDHDDHDDHEMDCHCDDDVPHCKDPADEASFDCEMKAMDDHDHEIDCHCEDDVPHCKDPADEASFDCEMKAMDDHDHEIDCHCDDDVPHCKDPADEDSYECATTSGGSKQINYHVGMIVGILYMLFSRV